MEQWSREKWEAVKEQSACAVYYLYTPICGTCIVASKMMEIVQMMRPELPIGKADLNYLEDLALDYKIESVPCLLITKEGQLREKIYTFESIPNLLEKIDGA